MHCPFCQQGDSRVIDSRGAAEGRSIRRRRECRSCGRRFTTFERAEENPLFVVKKDGRREPFSREKLLAGVTKACQKRPISREQIEAMVSEIEGLLRDGGSPETTSREIGEMVMSRLQALDEVAYVRFASVYKEFRDAGSFLREIDNLKRQPATGSRFEGEAS